VTSGTSNGAGNGAASTVHTEERDRVLVITIDRPKARNAIDGATATALAAAFDELDARADLAVGVLTGSGGVFSAGMDLKAFAAGDSPLLPGRGFGGLTRARPKTPLIAAVEGWAIGGGTEMALACDLVVAARDATFGLFEVTHGLVPPEGGIVRLTERLPRNVNPTGKASSQPLADFGGPLCPLMLRNTPMQGRRLPSSEVASSAPPGRPCS
jgi:enoyl-CoA hydratase